MTGDRSSALTEMKTERRSAAIHKFLIHKRGDHVGVATSDIEAGEEVIGVYMDDDTTILVKSRDFIPLGHKIAIVARDPGDPVLEYGIRIGIASERWQVGDYVHTHNLKSARW
jgi:(2R)-sulfolactate sulfo-lyase subunit alpha